MSLLLQNSHKSFLDEALEFKSKIIIATAIAIFTLVILIIIAYSILRKLKLIKNRRADPLSQLDLENNKCDISSNNVFFNQNQEIISLKEVHLSCSDSEYEPSSDSVIIGNLYLINVK